MDQRSSFLLQLLDKIGTPLMGAVQDVSAGGGDAVQDAKTLAALLGKSVQAGIGLAGSLPSAGEEDADAVRLALSALCAPLVAQSYRISGRVPGDPEIKRLSKVMESVVAFADNFSPASGHGKRLETLGQAPLFDPAQAQIMALEALVPAAAAIAEFPFGQNEGALLKDVAARLDQRARALRETLLGPQDEPAARYAELTILRALATLYAHCHSAHTRRLEKTPSDAGQPSLEPVWQDFDTRAAMLEVALSAGMPANAQAGSGAAAPAVPAQTPPSAAAPPSGGPMGFFKKSDAPPTGAPPMAPPAAAPPPAAGGNPMSFFRPGTKKASDQAE